MQVGFWNLIGGIGFEVRCCADRVASIAMVKETLRKAS